MIMICQNAPYPFEDELNVVFTPSNFWKFELQCHRPNYDDMWHQRILTMQKKDAVEKALVKQRQLMFWEFSVMQPSIIVWSSKLHRACLAIMKELPRCRVSRADSLLVF